MKKQAEYIFKGRMLELVSNKKNIYSSYILFLFSAVILFYSCSKNITIDLPPSEKRVVVEGHISAGQFPYVILSYTSDFYSTIYLDSLSNAYIKGAIVKVSNGTDTTLLQEILIDSAGVQIPVYVGLNMLGEEGKSYRLWIETGVNKLFAVATIPFATPLDSMWWEPSNGGEDDSLVRLICKYSDPAMPGNYVRYSTKRNSEPFYPGYNSVFEDAVINGTSFEFPLDRGVNRSDSDLFNNYGLFLRGDTITVNWSAIDFDHFNFWRTLEFELNGQGSPFATPVVIQSNIQGGIGIWGGYAQSFKTIIVPPR